MTLREFFLLPLDRQEDIKKIVLVTFKKYYSSGSSAPLSRRKTELELKFNGVLVKACIRESEIFAQIAADKKFKNKLQSAVPTVYLAGLDVT